MREVILLLTVIAATLVVASGVALAVTTQGGPRNDVVLGTDGSDHLGGGVGSDTIIGSGGKDFMWGGDLPPGPGTDPPFPPPEAGPKNDDIMTGGTGNDFMWGNMGSDRIVGGTGNDILLDGESAGGAYDILIGGAGNDFLWPRNTPAGQDLTLCGAGMDVAHVDNADIVIGCEMKWFRDPTNAEVNEYFKQRGLD
jgi:Ca2+-binding RTX toxin-like protein